MSITANTNIKCEKQGPASLYYGLALGAALLFFLLMFSMVEYQSYAAPEQDIALLAPIAAHKNSDDVTMVMIGNSRLRHAVTFGFHPETPVPLENGRNLWAVQYAQDVAMFETYETLWPEILAARPDYIVLQDVLFTTDRLIDIMSLAGFSNIIYNQLEKKILRRDPAAQWQTDRFDIIDSCIRAEDYNRAEMQDRLIFAAYRDRHALGGGNDNTDKAREAVKQALAAGIKVIILHLPSNSGVYEAFNVPADKIDFYGLGFSPAHEQLLPDSYNDVQWIDYPAPAPGSYCDFVHFNEQGRKEFTAHMLSTLD